MKDMLVLLFYQIFKKGNQISQEGILDHTRIKYTPNDPIHISGVPSYIASPLWSKVGKVREKVRHWFPHLVKAFRRAKIAFRGSKFFGNNHRSGAQGRRTNHGVAFDPLVVGPNECPCKLKSFKRGDGWVPQNRMPPFARFLLSFFFFEAGLRIEEAPLRGKGRMICENELGKRGMK